MSDILYKIIFNEEFNLLNISVATLVLLIGYISSRIVSRKTGQVFREKISKHAGAVCEKLAFYALLAITVAVSLDQLGIQITAVLAAAGFMSIAVAFAAQTSVSNVISGVFLLIDKPFETGDAIEANGTEGIVLSVGLLSTKLKTFDNLLVRIPNEKLLKSTIKNFSFYDKRRYDIEISLNLNEDMGKVKKAVFEVTDNCSFILTKPEPPLLIIGKPASSGITVTLRVWLERTAFTVNSSTLNELIKSCLEDNNIAISIPKGEIFLHNYAEK